MFPWIIRTLSWASMRRATEVWEAPHPKSEARQTELASSLVFMVFGELQSGEGVGVVGSRPAACVMPGRVI